MKENKEKPKSASSEERMLSFFLRNKKRKIVKKRLIPIGEKYLQQNKTRKRFCF